MSELENKILGQYKNGNYQVFIWEDGTKLRYNKLDTMIPDTIESMDIKITNCCDRCCKWCHEKSTPDGQHADILSPSFIDKLHPYTELAIGGGNILTHPDIDEFLHKCKELKLIPNITVNQKHFVENYDRIKKWADEKLVYGIGVSLEDVTNKKFTSLVKTIPNIVIHLIVGLVSIDALKTLSISADKPKVLFLGYKHLGRGIEYIENSIVTETKINMFTRNVKNNLQRMIDEKWFNVISFDNLALKQLEVEKLLSDKEWEEFYMGDDGIDGEMTSATMYVDMVNRVYAKNSCAAERFPLKDTIEEMYNHLKGENTNGRE